MQEAITNIYEANAPGTRLRTFAIEAQAQLNDLEQLALTVSQSIADSLSQAFTDGLTGLFEGTKTAKQVFADMLKGMSQVLMREATRMIATYIAIGLARKFAGMFGGGGDKAGDMGAKLTAMDQYMPKPNAKGNTFANGIHPFAMGGVVTSPTLFRFANGGAMRTGLMGEAGPEAIMPLTRGPGGRLGVDASGSGGGVNVTVNVDATGSKVTGDNQQAGNLGKAISSAIQQELIKQKRPGGLLA